MKTLIAYYSWSGNTKRLAQQIQKALPGADLFEIVPQHPYPSGMMAVESVDYAQKQRHAWPAINAVPSLKNYDRLLVGGPVWYWDLASPVISFLNQIQDYDGEVRPFYTSVGNSQRYAGWFQRRSGNLRLAAGYDDAHDNLQTWLKDLQGEARK